MESAKQNRETILEFFRRAEAGEDVMAMLAEDVVWWVPGEWELGGTYNKSEIGTVFGRVFSMLAEMPKFTIHNITAEEDRVCVDAASRATFKDGSPFGNTYHFLFRLRDGQIVEGKEYLDTNYMVKLLEQRPELAS